MGFKLQSFIELIFTLAVLVNLAKFEHLVAIPVVVTSRQKQTLQSLPVEVGSAEALLLLVEREQGQPARLPRFQLLIDGVFVDFSLLKHALR